MPTRLSLVSAISIIAMILSGCSDQLAKTQVQGDVVLYTSADDQLARLLAQAFTDESGIRVQILGDTEATKTTGLVTRILAERDDPQGDVWWSSEPMGTLLLEESGALTHGGMQFTVPDAWADELVSEDWTWVGFAQRVRVLAFSTDRVSNPPTTMRALVDPEWKGRIGMARPQFGTTRGHMALLHARWGGEAFDQWMRGLRSNKIRLYDGNASVVRAIAMGEIDVGITDTDDVYAGESNGWTIGHIYESMDEHETLRSAGPTTIPNTVALIEGGPNPLFAKRLAAFLVSERAERIIALSASRNIPVHPALSEEFSDLVDSLDGPPVSYLNAHRSVNDAMDACERTLMGP